ncbi:hypothetical protein B0T22DRAFT_521464 [Podospora appendiculata]|uniref:Uncharacterized protein n=1 Tax=Podospora appendiculata TaxID=314037 RepID=A0AAE1C7X7_9PEZI|nr:hypothetical protein B0T22DRAFT_521464 [Podospora appendiculata]
MARQIQEQLAAELDRAITSWGGLFAHENGPGYGHPSDVGSPTAPQPHQETASGSASQHFNSLTPQAQISQIPFHSAAQPTANPAIFELSYLTPWWMSKQNEYALLDAQEQALLERSARAASDNRCRPTGFQPVRQEVTSKEPNPSVQPSPFRPMPDIEFVDEYYDPHFWEKNLRPGNIWTNPPRTVYTDEPVSPRTILAYYPNEIPRCRLPGV